MGSSGERKRRARPSRSDDDQRDGQWELRNAPYTFEGEVEGIGRFAVGLKRRLKRLFRR